jgi:hypothetical protein
MATQINTNQIKDEAVTNDKLAPGPAHYWSGTTAVTIVNTAVEGSLASFTLAGGDLGSTGLLRIHAKGTMSTDNNLREFNAKIKLGGTDIIDVDHACRCNTNTGTFDFMVIISAAGGEANQTARGTFHVTGEVSATEGYHGGDDGTASEDATGDLTVDFRFSWDDARADTTITFEEMIVELFTVPA